MRKMNRHLGPDRKRSREQSLAEGKTALWGPAGHVAKKTWGLQQSRKESENRTKE